MIQQAIIDSIWGYSTDQLRQLESTVSKLRQLKEDVSIGLNGKVEPQTLPAEIAHRESKTALPSAVDRPMVPATAARQQLRSPKPGSLRDTIHRILQETGSPVQRAAIIREASKRTGATIDQRLKAKVGDILTCGLDPNIKRVAYGIYRYVQ